MNLNKTQRRIGFACRYMHHDQTLRPKDLKLIEGDLNAKGTTITWLNKQPQEVAEEKLWSLIQHNLVATERLIMWVAGLPPEQHMMRISSDLLPAYTHPDWSHFYRRPDVIEICERLFSIIGSTAQKHDIRLSFHPGPYTVLASDKPHIVENALAEFEYHADMIRWMGFGQKFQDFKCNVHISGKRGVAGLREILPRLTPVARNVITLENDEFGYGLDSVLELADDVPVVLDIHHHFIRTGEYIQPDDDRVKAVIDSWRGVRPTMHYSYSKEEYVGHLNDELPDKSILVESGIPATKLRAHSNRYPNATANRWALSFLNDFDIMCECKHKNLGSSELAEFAKEFKFLA